ncbi:glycosyltransferase [Yokenella regensburgei]|uniref:glycosyltransferase n=1 Tax=Yokenella regensburgei TaxID=158877 RepID=UPI003F161C36
MRILLTVHQFFPDYKAGTEVLTLSVARELIRRGHDVRIFTGYPSTAVLTEDERFDEYEYEGIHIYRFHHAYVPMAGQNSMIEVGYKNQLAVRYLRKICDDFKVELVHHFHLNRLGIGLINWLADNAIPQFYTPTDFWMVCPTAQLRLPDGTSCQGPDALSGNCVKHFAYDAVHGIAAKVISLTPDRVFGEIARITRGAKVLQYPMSNEVRAVTSRLASTVGALNRLQGIVAPNQFMYDLFQRYGVETHRLHESAFGIECEPVSTLVPVKETQPGSPLRLGFIGTLAPHKGCHVLIKALNHLEPGVATLKIYGNGDEFPEYLEELDALTKGNEAITFCGTFPNNRMTDILQELDILIIPSVWFENTPLVIYSAQQAKCPVIGSDMPGISAVITHGVNGLLFEAGSEQDLARKITEAQTIGIATLSNNAVPPKTTAYYVDELSGIWRV